MKKFAFLLLAALCLLACRTKYVPVTEYHEKVVHQHDTTIQRDTLIDHQTTIIREVDSAWMAQYGIRLEKAQLAYLVESNRMMREVQNIMQKQSDSVIIHDSVPVIIPVEKPPNLLQKAESGIATFVFWLCLAAIAFLVVRKVMNSKNNS